MSLIKYLIIFLISFNAYAGDEEKLKKNIVEKFTSGFSSTIENILDGEGDTKVQIDMGEDYHPEFSIVTVRPISKHHSNDATFIQLQLNEQKIRGEGRLSANIGIGYRKLSESKDSITGANVFVDYDEEGNARASVGLELKSSSFELLANYYQAISGGQVVGAFTERTLDGQEVSAIGKVPFIPWADIVATNYEWEADKNAENKKGNKFSLEMQLTSNIKAAIGTDDNNLDETTNFAKIMFVYPGVETDSASDHLFSKKAFVQIDMSSELLSIVRRSNKQMIESEGTGVVMARSN